MEKISYRLMIWSALANTVITTFAFFYFAVKEMTLWPLIKSKASYGILQVLSFIFVLDLVLFFTLSSDIDLSNANRKYNLVKCLWEDRGTWG